MGQLQPVTLAQRMIFDLARAGYSHTQIGHKLGCSRQHVYRIARGQRGSKMRFDLMDRLRDLHAETFPSGADE